MTTKVVTTRGEGTVPEGVEPFLQAWQVEVLLGITESTRRKLTRDGLLATLPRDHGNHYRYLAQSIADFAATFNLEPLDWSAVSGGE